ncbi:MAG: ribosome-associated translation inhibitor RaiA [Spirochaetia bacterium]|jgi:putative sigma-54 modulation protein|nr:ribosome-associated translation inhibitor RaiA [Spirochaetia bacterium]
MNLEIKGIHYEVTERTVEQIEKKVQKLDFAGDMIVDLLFRLEHDKSGYIISADINFRWGLSHHLKVVDHDLYNGIDKIIDKLKNKVTKEKEKIQSHTE